MVPVAPRESEKPTLNEGSGGPSRMRLVLADDHALILDALEWLFRSANDVEVVARCSGGLAAIDAVTTHDPDLLVLDMDMPDLDGLGVMRRLQAMRSRTKVVLLTAGISDKEAIEAIRLEARGIVLKQMETDTILTCVRAVHRSGIWVEPGWLAAARGLASTGCPDGPALTPRETEVVHLVASGMRNREIATELDLSEGTVKVHLHNVYSKLELSGRFDLIGYARRNDLS